MYQVQRRVIWLLAAAAILGGSMAARADDVRPSDSCDAGTQVLNVPPNMYGAFHVATITEGDSVSLCVRMREPAAVGGRLTIDFSGVDYDIQDWAIDGHAEACDTVVAETDYHIAKISRSSDLATDPSVCLSYRGRTIRLHQPHVGPFVYTPTATWRGDGISEETVVWSTTVTNSHVSCTLNVLGGVRNGQTPVASVGRGAEATCSEPIRAIRLTAVADDAQVRDTAQVNDDRMNYPQKGCDGAADCHVYEDRLGIAGHTYRLGGGFTIDATILDDDPWDNEPWTSYPSECYQDIFPEILYCEAWDVATVTAG